MFTGVHHRRKLWCDHLTCGCRGRNDAAKRDEALAAKYLRPLTAGSARIEFRPKTPKPAAEGAIKAVYMSAEITRVTPPRAGTSVYPGGNWQLPG